MRIHPIREPNQMHSPPPFECNQFMHLFGSTHMAPAGPTPFSRRRRPIDKCIWTSFWALFFCVLSFCVCQCVCSSCIIYALAKVIWNLRYCPNVAHTKSYIIHEIEKIYCIASVCVCVCNQKHIHTNAITSAPTAACPFRLLRECFCITDRAKTHKK